MFLSVGFVATLDPNRTFTRKLKILLILCINLKSGQTFHRTLQLAFNRFDSIDLNCCLF